MMYPNLIRCNNIALIFDSSSSDKRFPVRGPGFYKEGTGDQKDLGSSLNIVSIELRIPQIIRLNKLMIQITIDGAM